MAKSPKSSDRASRLPTWAPFAAWCVGLGGAGLAIGIALPKLMHRAASAPLPAPIRVVMHEPAWLPRDERSAIEHAVVRAVASSPFDRDGLVAARDAATRCGWFADVRQVRRSDVDEVIVDGTWAVPYALVCDGTGEHLVDTRGRILPRNYPAGKGPRLLRILGVQSPSPSAPGTAWPGDEVQTALSMAVLFADRPWRGQVASVDMAAWTRDGLLRFRTDRGCEITWGRAPGKESASEVPASQKLAALQMAFDRGGRIDAGATAALDLRGDMTTGR